MSRKPHPPVVCAESLSTPTTAEDVIALTLSVIRGRIFGPRSTEVRLLRQALANSGYKIVRQGAAGA